MIRECLGLFCENLTQKGERYILDNYVPKDGTYMFITMADEMWNISEPLDIIYDKKKGVLDGRDSPKYLDFCFLDYYSKLIDMNKPIEKKKIIHSNNYYAFFIKKESLSDPKFTQSVIDEYYSILKEPRKKYKDAKSLELYQQSEESLGKLDVTALEQIHDWISLNLRSIHIDASRKDYLKLFFVYTDMGKTKECYKRESQRYEIPNIYNSNKFNMNVDGKIVGLPNNNLGMNAKKPYLANHSRKIEVPYLINQEEAVLQARFYDFLMGYASKGRVNLYFDYLEGEILAFRPGEYPKTKVSGYFLRLRKGKKEVEIHNADVVVSYSPNLCPAFYHKKILSADRDDYGVINERSQLEKLIDDIFFNKSLISNYFTNPGDLLIRDERVLNQLVAIRERLFSWFYKNNEINIWPVLRDAGKFLIKNSICRGFWKKAKFQINLLWSLEDFFAGNKKKEEDMNYLEDQFENYMDDKNGWRFRSDEEYYFGVGQLVSYFISISNSKKKPLSLINPFMNADNDNMIKKHMTFLFKKYNYRIDYNNLRVKRLYSNVMQYHPKQPMVDAIVLSAGLTSDCFIFK